MKKDTNYQAKLIVIEQHQRKWVIFITENGNGATDRITHYPLPTARCPLPNRNNLTQPDTI
ncbi:MAG: hypothetical protein AAF152_01505 [Cyanobacteria bacterium P01_A01_bin.114]